MVSLNSKMRDNCGTWHEFIFLTEMKVVGFKTADGKPSTCTYSYVLINKEIRLLRLSRNLTSKVRELASAQNSSLSELLWKMRAVKKFKSVFYDYEIAARQNIYGIDYFEGLDRQATIDQGKWEGGRYRDKMSRFTPDGKQRIVVVGYLTWGDGPEEWSGWWLADRMADFNLLEPLGIR